MPKLINKTQGFTIVSNTILKNKKLSLKARGLMATLLSLPDGWEFSVRGLTSILPDGRDAISAACKELEQKGYLQRVKAKNEAGRYTGYDWIINDTPAEKPVTENPSPEKPSPEKPSSENPYQLNTKEFKKNNKSLKNQSINQSVYKEIPKEYWSTKRDLEEMIGYEMMRNDEIAKDIFEVCVEICMEKEDTIKIGKKQIPTSIFQSRIKDLYYEDILHIADSMRSVSKEIANPKNYILTALYNEKTTSNLYWTNKVKTDGAV